MSAYSLQQLWKRSFQEGRDFKIIRTVDQDDYSKSFWFSANRNVKTKIVSSEDIGSYWLILEEGPSYKVVDNWVVRNKEMEPHERAYINERRAKFGLDPL